MTISESTDYIAGLVAEIALHISPRRLKHSLSVADMCRFLCDRYHLDPLSGYLAGLCHDIARELPPAEILDRMEKSGEPLSDRERRHPILLHGPLGARIAADRLGIRDPQVLEAIACHTRGPAGKGPIAKVLFIADYIEPLRAHPVQEFYHRLKTAGLDEMVEMVAAGRQRNRAAGEKE